MARTDRDRWDLATSVGATATMVAAQRALSSEAKLIDDPYAAPLVRAVGIDVYVRLVNGEIEAGGNTEFDPRRMAQGMACRTRFYDQFFLDATRGGIGQVVILASGLDSRAYRLPWPAGTVVYEVDMPEVIEFKTLTLGDLGAEPTAQRRTVAIDLRDDWASALRAAGFDPQAPSAWSAEGLVVYLPDDAQDALFDNVTSLSAPGSRLAFEFVPDTAVFADPRWRAHHDRMSELGFEIDFNDLVYHGQRSHIVDHLNQRGWQTSSTTVADLHAANGFVYADDDVAAAFADVTYCSAVLGR
ncbi:MULTISPECIES: class I SAM-dependent methyltransferase [Mycobacterium]|jgi:methyltransferase (TIGR00027 family)|uniref:S-adenosyl-L-methionine-dependent methyltransferase n=3 Tax=Mycobacterium avium complex (MAC) TaxID=120793 RepID=A0AAE4RG15_MYCIT|nr:MULTISPECIES: class I SAM-dependent methyltransferase [Mycobacterium]AFC41906.1 methyltransferase, putative, family protein [Mycobacterium intracellulare ATCC 13950]AFC52209.1 methyltransferase, putative, family protein [Mycobacterium paraintracellulare]MCA2320868.1 class I SAM-dependent methyltransferase [Mycobacterium intracellulare]MCA2341397.1 class I SAM-dependent methyltransferase [Mycobacterium intracellulare]MDV6977067.1 class I SAM-dependent methyltransferase [Mycobacterium intrace